MIGRQYQGTTQALGGFIYSVPRVRTECALSCPELHCSGCNDLEQAYGDTSIGLSENRAS